MKDTIYASETNRLGAHEVALRVREMERQQARLLARLAADAREAKKPKRSFLSALMTIALIFGIQRQF